MARLGQHQVGRGSQGDSPPAGSRPDYGLDAPGAVRFLAIGGAAAVAFGILAYFALRTDRPELATDLLNGTLWPGLSWTAAAVLMRWGSRIGKLRLRDRVLDGIFWRGDEHVLDAGCGHGLLLLGAARRLSTGRTVGVDLWAAKDQADNRPEATLRNALLEGVQRQVDLVTGDLRQLPFAAGTFDVILSSWVLHNIWGRSERERAVREIARVLKPGGRVMLLDIWYTESYAWALRQAGLTGVRRRLVSFCFGTPTFLVDGHKAASVRSDE